MDEDGEEREREMGVMISHHSQGSMHSVIIIVIIIHCP